MKILLRMLTFLLLSGCTLPLDTSNERAAARLLVERGISFTRSGEYENAYAAYELAYDTYPLAAALDGMGCILLVKGKISQAEAYFYLASEQDPLYRGWIGNLALLREIQGDKESAMDLYSRFLKENSFDTQKRTNYAAFLYDRSMVPKTEAFIELRKAIVVGGSVPEGAGVARANVTTAESFETP